MVQQGRGSSVDPCAGGRRACRRLTRSLAYLYKVSLRRTSPATTRGHFMLHRPGSWVTRPAGLFLVTAIVVGACASSGASPSPSGAVTSALASPSAAAPADPSVEPIGGALTVYNAQHESLTQAWVDEF